MTDPQGDSEMGGGCGERRTPIGQTRRDSRDAFTGWISGLLLHTPRTTLQRPKVQELLLWPGSFKLPMVVRYKVRPQGRHYWRNVSISSQEQMDMIMLESHGRIFCSTDGLFPSVGISWIYSTSGVQLETRQTSMFTSRAKASRAL